MSDGVTAEGTRRFKERFEGRGKVAQGHFRQFGGFYFSSIGMGTYLGNPDSQTDALVAEAVKASVRSGAINVIDTAINYRFQKAEKSVGRALRQLFDSGEFSRDEIFISSKNGYLSHDADVTDDFWGYIQKELVKPGIIRPEDIVGQSHCMTIPYLRDQLERSLRNLGLECIDLMYVHNAAEAQLSEVGRAEFFARLEQTFEFYEEERTRGRIQFYGMATWSCFRLSPSSDEYLALSDVVGIAERAIGKDHGFRCVQLPLNLAMPEALTLKNQKVNGENLTFLEAAEKLNIGVFASAPMLQGQLATNPRVPKLPGLTAGLSCIQFVRSSPGVIAPLVGHKAPSHVKENLSLATKPPLEREEFVKTFFRQG